MATNDNAILGEAPAPLSRRCIFGDGKAKSREHMFPEWLNKTFRLPEGYTHDQIYVVRGNDGPRRPIPKIATFETSSKCVCRDCNSGWMSELESEVRPTLAAMVNGYPRSISPSQQLAIARWVTLKAACFDADPKSSNEPVASVEARRTIRGGESLLTAGRVPDRWAVWLGVYDRPGYFTCAMPYGTGLGAGGVYLAQFSFLMVINFVVLIVQGRTGGVSPPPHEQLAGGFNLLDREDDVPALVNLWPSSASGIEWPLRRSLGPTDLSQCVTFGLPDSVAQQEDVRKQRDDILSHVERATCQCGSNHERLPEIALPIQEPYEWLPE